LYDINLKFYFHYCVLHDEMNKTRSHLHMFKKIKLIYRCFKFSPSISFNPVRFTSVQLTSSPPFLLPGVVSPTGDVITPSCYVMFPFHWTKTSSLSPLHLLATFCPVFFSLEPKLKYWICTITVGYPPWTARLPPSIAIKRSSQPWLLFPSLNHVSILSHL
jgi:hypothetical protein